MRETFEFHPETGVADTEYRRLLGFPRGYEPGARAQELAAAARRWYAEHGRPWMYLREAELQLTDGVLRIDGVEFHSRQLHEHLRRAGAVRTVLAAVSAGRDCEDHAHELWQEGKPDEYFFLEIFGSAVVEHLMAAASGRICELADGDHLIAVPHYSPGYSGWDVADQNKLFALITRGMARSFPGPLEVLASGMLKPKKSQLGVFGLTARTPHALAAARLVPCHRCSFAPCQYRRAPYRPASVRVDGAPPTAARPAPATP